MQGHACRSLGFWILKELSTLLFKIEMSNALKRDFTFAPSSAALVTMWLIKKSPF